MASFASVFITAGRQRLIAALVAMLCFALTLGLLGAASLKYVHGGLRTAAGTALKEYETTRQHVQNAFQMLEQRVTAQPCSDAFIAQLRRVAFVPDGLNEFIYAPGGVALCSTSVPRYAAPVPLGAPEVPGGDYQDVSVWLDRPLDILGLDGLSGSIVGMGDFAIVVPPRKMAQMLPDWLRMEAVLSINGRTVHRAGTPGLYASLQAAESAGPMQALREGLVYELACGKEGYFCVAASASLPGLISAWTPPIILAVMFAFLAASWCGQLTGRFLRHRWSFEARFKRNLTLDNIVCVYQPLMDLQSGRIIGCEVLARWRDLDDAIITPDRFIPVVERAGLTLHFTALVVARAFEDLSHIAPGEEPMQVNFNIFPRDLDEPELPRLFTPFLYEPDRFTVALEIVETDALDLSIAVPVVEELRAVGLKVYIDDFGSGYSSVETIVALPVDGVKLDRGFAMAPNHTMMNKMLDLAVEMIGATGRLVVVEGVETLERLLQLRHSGAPVTYVQGYAISRPVDAAAFAAQLHARALDEPHSKAA